MPNRERERELIYITHALCSVYRNAPGWTGYKLASATLHGMLLRDRTCLLCFPTLYPFIYKQNSVRFRQLLCKPNHLKLQVLWLTWAIVYSQSRFSPSNRYWSAALRRSCDISIVMSTDPVYINLGITIQVWVNYIFTRVLTIKKPVSSSYLIINSKTSHLILGISISLASFSWDIQFAHKKHNYPYIPLLKEKQSSQNQYVIVIIASKWYFLISSARTYWKGLVTQK